MGKTQFADNGTTLTSAFMNKVFGNSPEVDPAATGDQLLIAGHRHDGQDGDGHCGKIDLTKDVKGFLPLANVAPDVITAASAQAVASTQKAISDGDALVTTNVTKAAKDYTDSVAVTAHAASFMAPVGAIVMWPKSEPPVDPTGAVVWLLCNGQSAPPALAAIIGMAKVPDLMGRFPLGMGSGMGLTPRNITDLPGGAETHTLNLSQIPALPDSHTHSGTHEAPDGKAQTVSREHAASIDANNGGGLAHNNMPPYCVVNFIIRAS